MSESVIDSTVFTELQVTTGAEFAVELVKTFFEEAPGLLSELRSAREASNAARFRRAAHSIKSNANKFGALTLAALARELEINGLAANSANDLAALATMDAEYARAAAALKVLSDG